MRARDHRNLKSPTGKELQERSTSLCTRAQGPEEQMKFEWMKNLH